MNSSNRRHSPIKIKDYFTNPLHKIKQPSFLQTGFNETHLNTFVKSFTNKSDPNFISIHSIRKFIQSFTNGNPKLMQTYEDFFYKNFEIQNRNKPNGDNIELQHFLEFFLKEQQHDLEEFSQSQWKKLYEKDLSPLTARSLVENAQDLGIPMTLQEAKNVIKMVNLDCGTGQMTSQITFQTFLRAMKQQE